MAKGRLKDNGVHLQPHEYHSIKLLLDLGHNIELIPESDIKGMKMPDILMDGIPWEIKAPQGDSRKTIKHNIQNAAHQSENVIIDLCRCKQSEMLSLREIKRQFELTKSIKRMKVVKKSEEIIDFNM